MASRDLRVTFVGDPASLSRAFKKVGDDADRTGKRITGFATVSSKGISRVGVAMGGLATAGAGAAALLGKSFIQTASDINESLTKNQVLFGRYAQDVAKFSESSAKSFGISKQAALEYTGTFGNLFRSMNISRQESARFSTNLTRLAADMASFNNSSIEDALEAIRSGLVGESEPLRRFGVNLNDAALRQEALRQGLVRTTKDALDPQQKALATMALVTKQTSAAHGDFERTSGGLANQMRILKARLSDAGAELGEKLLPFALKAAQALNRMIDQAERGKGPLGAMKRAFSAVSDALSDANVAITKWGHKNRDELSSVGRANQRLQNAFQDMRRSLGPVLNALGDNATAMGRTVRNAFGTIIKLLQGDFEGALRDALRAAREYFTGMGRFAGRLLREINQTIGDIRRVGTRLGKALIDGIVDGIKSAAGVGGDSAILKGLKQAIPGVGPLLNLGDGLGKQIGQSMGVPGLGGGALQGADPDLAPFAGVGARFGLRVSSGIRPGSITSTGNQSYHATGDAIDLAGPAGGMMQAFRTLKKNFGSRLRELIYTPGGVGIKDGRPFRYTGQVAADHYDHVHVAYTGPFGDGIGDAARSAARYWRGNDLVTAVAVAGPESTYRDAARLVTSQEDSRGMWQVNTRAHPWAAGLNLRDTDTAAGAAHRVWRQAGGSWRPWSAFTSGKYRSFLGQARAAVAALGRGGGASGASGGGGGSAGTVIGTAGGGFAGAPWMKGNKGKIVGGAGSGIPGGGADPGGLANSPSGTDYIDRAAALAALTPGSEDDVSAARSAVDFWQKALASATGTADPRDDTAAAQGLKSALDALEALTGELEAKRRQEEQDRALREEQVSNQRKLLAIAQMQPHAIFAALAAAMDGQIGGPVGLGFSSVGYAGKTAAY